MQPELLDAVEINPPREPRACVIWLHGLGADGHDFEPLIPQLGIVDALDVRFVLPHAPRRPVTINGGMLLRAWHDILAPDFRAGEDNQGIRESGQQLHDLVAREEASGIPAERTLLAGFSQGGAIALHAGLRYPRRLAGILALSTWLPLADTLANEGTAVNRSVPIMMAHGVQDPVVPLGLAERSRDTLRQTGYAVDWYTYQMSHAVCSQEVQAIRSWMVNVLGAAES
jgi:phospholipase/carboxylesterase